MQDNLSEHSPRVPVVQDLKLGGFSPNRLRALDDEMASIVASGELPGLVGLLYRRGDIAHVTTHGWQDIAAAKPIRRDTIFQIMSMTKPITAAAALALVDDGRVGLHEPIENYLPEFSRQRVLRTPSSSLDDTVDRARPITLADLLTFRAGIATRVSPMALTPTTPVKTAISEAYDKHRSDPEAWLSAVAAVPLETQPGTIWAYGTASEVVTLLISRVSGLSFAEFLQERIFNPLGMKDTGYSVSLENQSRLATAYERDAETSEARVLSIGFFADHRPSASLPSFPRGGYGLVSTIDDYLQFARMLLEGGAVDGVRILSRRLASLMVTNYLSDRQRATVPAPVLDSYRGQGWGLGLQVVIDPALQEQYVGYASRGSFGFSGALGTWWQADPQEKMIQIFLYQLLSPNDRSRQRFQNLGYEAIEE